MPILSGDQSLCSYRYVVERRPDGWYTATIAYCDISDSPRFFESTPVIQARTVESLRRHAEMLLEAIERYDSDSGAQEAL